MSKWHTELSVPSILIVNSFIGMFWSLLCSSAHASKFSSSPLFTCNSPSCVGRLVPVLYASAGPAIISSPSTIIVIMLAVTLRVFPSLFFVVLTSSIGSFIVCLSECFSLFKDLCYQMFASITVFTFFLSLRVVVIVLSVRFINLLTSCTFEVFHSF